MSTPKLAFNVLVKFEDGLWVAHCLELDIVATGDDPRAAVADLQDLILAQVASAIENRNLEYLYHPAPQETWEEYRLARALDETSSPDTALDGASFFQTIFANAFPPAACHA